jgi:hypothetical protein
MPVSGFTSRDTILRQRAKRPHKTGGTLRAKAETLAEAVARRGGAGVGIVPDSGVGYAPFDNLAEYERYARMYDPVAMGRIATALRNPLVHAKITHNTGTAPELHVVGKFLHLGWKIGVELFFQDISIIGFRRLHRTFTADVGIWWYGQKILLPVDGEYFHDRLQIQRADTVVRDTTLVIKTHSRVVDIPALTCLAGSTLDEFFRLKLGAVS